MNPLLKFVILLHTKSDEKLPHDNISHFLFLEVARGYNLSCASAMHFGPNTLLFGKIWYKMFQGFLRCMQVWKWEDRKIPGTQQPGVHTPWSSGINFAGPNNIYTTLREFKSGIDMIIEITPGTINFPQLTAGAHKRWLNLSAPGRFEWNV